MSYAHEFSINLHHFNHLDPNTFPKSRISERNDFLEQEYFDNYDAVSHHAGHFNDRSVVNAKHKYFIKKYTTNSKPINKHLLDNHLYHGNSEFHGDHKDAVDALDDLLSNHKNALKKDAVVYSGLGSTMSARLSGSEIGEKVHFPTYTSTSLMHDVARGFGDPIPGKESGIKDPRYHHTPIYHVAAFHLPEGYTKGKYIAPASSYKGMFDDDHEHELLLKRKQDFHLFDKTFDPITHRLYHHLSPE